MNQSRTRSQDLSAPQPGFTASSEATRIEQSRVVAEVQGQLVMARQFPRDRLRARSEIMEACKNPRLAEQAFFSFPRGGERVSGPSIHLAREIARCWGNVNYAIMELRRNDDAGESEMMAFAWDLETNTRAMMHFIQPHARDTRSGRKQLVELRDIYENNSNAGARRLREVIFNVMPRALLDEAQEQCHTTLREGGGVPLDERRRKAVQAWGSKGVTPQMLEARIGCPIDRADEVQIANLVVLWSSIERAETTIDEAFDAPAATRKTSAAALSAPSDQKPSQESDPAAGQQETQPSSNKTKSEPAEKPDPEPTASIQDSRFHVKLESDLGGQVNYEGYAMALEAVAGGVQNPDDRREFLRANPALDRLIRNQDIDAAIRKRLDAVRNRMLPPAK